MAPAFSFDRGGIARGIEFEPEAGYFGSTFLEVHCTFFGWPVGFMRFFAFMDCGISGRFASVGEYYNNPEVFHSLILSDERAVLEDGIIHGPRLGYRIEKTDSALLRKEKFHLAICAIPIFMEPSVLSVAMKCGLIFQYFDKDTDESLNQLEFFLWANLCEKLNLIPSTQDFYEIVEAINQKFRCYASYHTGLKFQDLTTIYATLGEDVLNHDYIKLFGKNGFSKLKPKSNPQTKSATVTAKQHARTNNKNAVLYKNANVIAHKNTSIQTLKHSNFSAPGTAHTETSSKGVQPQQSLQSVFIFLTQYKTRKSENTPSVEREIFHTVWSLAIHDCSDACYCFHVQVAG